MPLLITGAADDLAFTDREVALACGSHNGEPIHTELAASMLKKIGLGPEALHAARTSRTARSCSRARARGEQPNALHNNCSGKHAGMLAVAVHLGASIDNYESPENPCRKR
jgi:L-asparaginase II